jgi:hypothetical protein
LAERIEILTFVVDYNEQHGQGGRLAAAKHFDATGESIRNWISPKGKQVRIHPEVAALACALMLQKQIAATQKELAKLRQEHGILDRRIKRRARKQCRNAI